MSDANAASLVRRFIDALNASDGVAAAHLLSEDVAHDLPSKGREIGADAVRAWMSARAARSAEQLGDVVILTGEGGGRAAAEFTRRGRGSDGASYSTPGGLFFEIEDGKIIRISDYSA